jgi:hypothetical protein
MMLHSFTREGQFLIKSCNLAIKQLFAKKEEKVPNKLIIITPHSINTSINYKDGIWEIIHKAWENITFSKNNACLNEWRIIFDYGKEVFPGLRIFRLKNSNKPVYYFLIDKSGIEAISFFNDMLFILRAWQHIKNSRGYFHGAGIVHKNGAYLFLGPSGAGKSTVSIFSSEFGHKVIHDDHIVALKSKNGKYLVSDIAFKIPGVSLKAILFLVQDKKDKLIPFSQTQTAQGLFKSLFELPSEKVLYGSYLIKAFNVCADIARAVPGYELHFTKSPTFWKVIEDETGL